jgi:hypothetical protein
MVLPILAAVMLTAFKCGGENNPVNSNINATGYITNYVICNGIVHNENNDSAQAVGYYIISENLQDTFVTANLSDNLNKFPIDFFRNTDNYRYSYKINFEYEYGDTAIVCTAMYPDIFPYAKGIKIISATLINQNHNENNS